MEEKTKKEQALKKMNTRKQALKEPKSEDGDKSKAEGAGESKLEDGVKPKPLRKVAVGSSSKPKKALSLGRHIQVHWKPQECAAFGVEVPHRCGLSINTNCITNCTAVQDSQL